MEGAAHEPLIDETDDPERQNEKLRRITEVLMDRAERNLDQTGTAFSLFQRAISLEGEVRARTSELQRTLDELNRANAELAAASAAAEEANRAKSRFVAAASHDVRQPLTAARLFIEQIGKTALDPEQHRIVGQLASAFTSVESILGAVLDISRLDSSAAEAETTRLPVMQVLASVTDQFGPLAADAGVRLTLVPSGAWIESDPFYLRQIVQNLVSNAVKYCDGGRVLIGCRPRGTTLAIEVHDTGPGIAAEDQSLIFAEFTRLPGQTRRGAAADGVGLGLAIVDRACRLLGHRLTVRSTPGRGTCFAISVPMAMPDAAPPSPDPGDGPQEAETRIVLVISPDPALSDQICTMLDQWGMNGLAAATPGDCEGMISQLGMMPDAVIVDAAALSGPGAGALGNTVAGAARVLVIGDPGSWTARADTIRLNRPIRPHRLRAALS